jgi:hypothetical protein
VGTVTVDELVESIDFETGQLKDYEPGDTVQIKDIIQWTDYNEELDVTFISFGGKYETVGHSSGTEVFFFQGDLTSEYKKGETVLITIKVIEDSEGNVTFDVPSDSYLTEDYIQHVPTVLGILGVVLVVVGIIIVIAGVIISKLAKRREHLEQLLREEMAKSEQ